MHPLEQGGAGGDGRRAALTPKDLAVDLGEHHHRPSIAPCWRREELEEVEVPGAHGEGKGEGLLADFQHHPASKGASGEREGRFQGKAAAANRAQASHQ
jgi:hypothetical protein